MPWLGLWAGGRWGCDCGSWGLWGWRGVKGPQGTANLKATGDDYESEMLLVGAHREQTSGKPVLSLWGECK